MSQDTRIASFEAEDLGDEALDRAMPETRVCFMCNY